MRILGIDPGLRTTGFGIIEQRGQSLIYIASGVVRTPNQTDLPERLQVIFSGVREIAEQYQPQETAIEKVFVNVNPQATLLLGQARGSAICALVTQQLPVAEYTALQIKQATVGYGKAQKKQVQEMVQRLLNLPTLTGTDASDALACAICHAHSKNLLTQVRRNIKSGKRLRTHRSRLCL